MSTAIQRRVFNLLCREFLTTSANMTREAKGRAQDAVSASRARVVLSEQTLRRSEARLARCAQRLIDAETAQSRTRQPA